MHKQWLTRQTTVSEAEAEESASMKGLYEFEGEVLPADFKPFEHPAGQWRKLVAAMQPGDELWWFQNSSEAWAGLCGCKGLAVVRNGEVVDYFVTMRS